MKVSNDYRLFLNFIDNYLNVGFEGIKKSDPLMREIHEMMKKNRQYFYIADMLQLRILYTCQTVQELLGIEPLELNPAFQFRGTHPEDISRHSTSRARMFQLCHDMYIESINTGKEKYAVMSTSMRYWHADGHYINFLVQGYAFTTSNPVPTTYTLFVNTDISWFGPIKHGYNYYIGDDLSYFRVPDKKLILTGCIFTDREFEIIKLIREGLHSAEIGKKLFISPHTVDTHRRNILKKTDKATTSELIIDLQEKGFF